MAQMSKNTRNIIIIGTVAIGINILESILVPNLVEQKFDKNWKFKLPKISTFASGFVILGIMSLFGGFVSDRVITAMQKPKNYNSDPPPLLAGGEGAIKDDNDSGMPS